MEAVVQSALDEITGYLGPLSKKIAMVVYVAMQWRWAQPERVCMLKSWMGRRAGRAVSPIWARIQRYVWPVVVGSGLWAAAVGAQANVTLNSVAIPSSVGRTMDVDVDVAYTRTSTSPVSINVTIPPELAVNPPAPPAGCAVTGNELECSVPAGGVGSTGVITFPVRGQAIGGFNLTAHSTNGSTAVASSNVRASGDLTVAQIQAPSNTLIAGQETTFTLQPKIAAGGDDVPTGGSVVVTTLLPATATDFELTDINFTGKTPSCTAVGAANTSRTLTCTYSGPVTLAQINTSTIVLKGHALKNGNFQNSVSIGSGSNEYIDRDGSNNTENVPFTVNPGGDLQALGSFPAQPVLLGSSQNLTLTYKNNGPMQVPAGGVISTIIPANFTIGTLPAGCVNEGAGSITVGGPAYSGTKVSCTAGVVNSGSNQDFILPLTLPSAAGVGDFPIQVDVPPTGFSDFDIANNVTTRHYIVSAPYADLSLTKSKTGGPKKAGDTITNTFTVKNEASSPSAATYDAANPLRVVDWAMPEEVDGDTVTDVTPGWTCTVQPGQTAPASLPGATTRISCYTLGSGSLAPGASITLSYKTTLDSTWSAGQKTLQNLACTGGTALTGLGGGTTGPQPADTNTANDCSGIVGGLVLTDVTTAKASVVKTASVDGTNYSASGAELAGEDETMHWRMVVTTDASNTQNIPTLWLVDNLIPGRVDYTNPAEKTPVITIATNPSTYGSCPASLPAGTGGVPLKCEFSNVPADTTITVDFSVQRPVTSGLLTNTATITSPDAILAASLGGQLESSASLTVKPRLDVEVSTKTVQPSSPRVGESVEFVLTVRNNGTDAIEANGFVLTDTLNIDPAANEVAYGNISAAGTNMDCSASNYGAGQISCKNTNAVGRATTRTVTIKARILKPTSAMPSSGNVFEGQTNRADVALADNNLCEFVVGTSTACNDAAAKANNYKQITFAVQVPQIDMQQGKERILPAGQTAFGFGDQLRYRFRLQSVGPSRAEKIVMTDTLTVPSGFTLTLAGGPQNVNAAPAESGFSLDGSKTNTVICSQAGGNGVVTCHLASSDADNFLDAGREVNFELAFDMNPATSGVPVTFGNMALVCADETNAYESSGKCSSDPVLAANNIASVNDVVFPKADIEVVSKTASIANVSVMQPFNYTIVVRNNGPQEARGVSFTDPLPDGMVLTGPPVVQVVTPGFSTTACSGAVGEKIVDCAFGTVQSGAELTLTLPVQINKFTAATLSNTAKVSVDEDATYDTDPSNNEKTEVVNVQRFTLSGKVFQKADSSYPNTPFDGATDAPIGGVPITVTGKDIAGNTILVTGVTESDGSYSFDLPPSDTAGYAITRGDVPLSLSCSITPCSGAQLGSGPAAPGAVQDAEHTQGVVLDANGVNYDFWVASNDITLKPPTVSGYVYFDRDRDRERPPIPEQDPIVKDWTVTLWAELAGGGREKVCELKTDQYGFYQFDNVRCNTAGYTQWAANGLPTTGSTPAGYGSAIDSFSIEFSNDDVGSGSAVGMPQSGNGAGATQPRQITGIDLQANSHITEQNLPIDPAGVVYDAITRQPIPGARVYFDGPNGAPVPTACLVSGLNPVVTNATGMYQFELIPGAPGCNPGDIPDGDYTLRIEPPVGYVQGASALIPPCANPLFVGNPGPFDVQNSDAPPGNAAALHDPGLCPVTAAGLSPANQNSTQYYYTVNLTTSGPNPSGNLFRNHIPLDPMQGGALVVTKTTPKLNVTKGELVPYTITATNTLSAVLPNVDMQDQIPPGFRYRQGSATYNGMPLEPLVSGRLLTWKNQTFAAGEKKNLPAFTHGRCWRRGRGVREPGLGVKQCRWYAHLQCGQRHRASGA